MKLKDTTITYPELRDSMKGFFPQLSDTELDAAMFALWARVVLKRMGFTL